MGSIYELCSTPRQSVAVHTLRESKEGRNQAPIPRTFLSSPCEQSNFRETIKITKKLIGMRPPLLESVMIRGKVSKPQLIGSFPSSGSGKSSKGRWGWGVLGVGMRVVPLQTLLVSLNPSNETITSRYLNGLSAGLVPGSLAAPSSS